MDDYWMVNWLTMVNCSLAMVNDVQNPCWLIVMGHYTMQYMGDCNTLRTGNPYKPTSIME